MVAKQEGMMLRKHSTNAGDDIELLYMGRMSAEVSQLYQLISSWFNAALTGNVTVILYQEIFNAEHSSNRVLTWGCRFLGWFFMFIGFLMMASILTTLGG